MSDTPRTDDQSTRFYNDATGARDEYVKARFARQLERELNAANAEIQELKTRCDDWKERMKKYTP
jgi:hypothetical protein